MTKVKDWETNEFNIDTETCKFCKGDSGITHPKTGKKITSQAWCASTLTCSATIDWDKVYGSD